MRVVVFGSTGRVGAAAVRAAVAAGHAVRAAVRKVPDPSPFESSVNFAIADARDAGSVNDAVRGMDAAIVAIGGDVFAPSDIVTRSSESIVAALTAQGIRRYIGITGVAQMKPSLAGYIAQAALRVSPIRHAVTDHQRAFDIVSASTLDWTLAGCPWIKDDAHAGRYSEHPDVFPGGFHTIAPVDVATFLVSQLGVDTYVRRIVGLW